MSGPAFDLVEDGESSEAPAVICRVRLSRANQRGGPIPPGLCQSESSARHAAGDARLGADREFVA